MDKHTKRIVENIKKGFGVVEAIRQTFEEKVSPIRQSFGATMVETVEEIVPMAKGLVTIRYQDEGDPEWHTHCSLRPNLLVMGSRKMMTHVIAPYDVHTSSENYRVKYFMLGTKGHDTDITIPVSPSISDTKLNAALSGDEFPPGASANVGMAVFEKELNENPLTNTTTFNFDGNPQINESALRLIIPVASGEANDEAWTEAGLFSENGIMFSRITFPVIYKTSGRTIIFEWILIF